MEDSVADDNFGQLARETLIDGMGRRDFVKAVTAVGAGVSVVGLQAGCVRSGSKASAANSVRVLQPGQGDIPGRHYLGSKPDEVLWGYVPNVHAAPVLRVRSGDTVTVDAVSHEGILEDQGRNPVAYFGSKGVAESEVLQDAVAIASQYNRTPRDFDKDGPHVVTGPVFVEGASPGDVLKIETLEATPRVPYGVVSSRHGKGALARTPRGDAPAGITLDEVMPPVADDGRVTRNPAKYGNVSTFTAVVDGHGVMRYGSHSVRFPLNPFMGMMGVAFSQDSGLTAQSANSIPPTLGGGNIDIRLLGVGSTFYLPVFAEGALFYAGDPHMAMGNGEVSLTAMEGALRGTFRLTACKRGSGDAPAIAYRYPFAETADLWVPIGLSDPDGSVNGQVADLDVAMRRAIVNALDFLEHDKGMDRPTAYSYLSAAADFSVSQVVDRTTGVHGQISKAHFA